ncbi:MAG: carbohydrate kinase [Bacteroidaceae bacterium]|nr:carbohydrate kinase [Bacteroidaceae bacterium]
MTDSKQPTATEHRSNALAGKAIGIGETILDIVFLGGQPVAAVPGGSCFNSVISLGRAGVPCSFVGYVGNDRPGRDISQFLRDNGVSTDNFEMLAHEKTAISLAYLDENGDASYTFYKNTPQAAVPWNLPAMTAGDVLLLGSYFAICDGTRTAIVAALQQARESGATIYYDLNFRRSHREELPLLRAAIESNFRQASIVRGSADDFEVMYDCRDARTIYREHIAAHCPVFICTAGAGQITVCTPQGALDFAAPRVDDVVSTVGAGDNFNAGFIVGLQRLGIRHADLARLPREQWAELVRYATAFAGEACRSTQNYVSRAFAATV